MGVMVDGLGWGQMLQELGVGGIKIGDAGSERDPFLPWCQSVH